MRRRTSTSCRYINKRHKWKIRVVRRVFWYKPSHYKQRMQNRTGIPDSIHQRRLLKRKCGYYRCEFILFWAHIALFFIIMNMGRKIKKSFTHWHTKGTIQSNKSYNSPCYARRGRWEQDRYARANASFLLLISVLFSSFYVFSGVFPLPKRM